MTVTASRAPQIEVLLQLQVPAKKVPPRPKLLQKNSLHGRLIFIHHQCWEVLPFCRFQRQRCIKIRVLRAQDFYTPLALKTAKGQHLPALVVYKNQSPITKKMFWRNFVIITKESLYKANSLACFLVKRDPPVAATLQRKSSGGIIFVIITKIITK